MPEPYTDYNHFWIAKMGVLGELYRFRNSFSVLLYSDIELIASSNNAIRFGPRAFYWQEEILFNYRDSGCNFQASFNHRCKHVDNADLFTLYREIRVRVIIWDSVVVRIFPEPFKIFEHGSVRVVGFPFIRNDFYVLAV